VVVNAGGETAGGGGGCDVAGEYLDIHTYICRNIPVTQMMPLNASFGLFGTGGG
jgi:hypothetical protein